MTSLPTLDQVNVSGKKVLVRLDLNVPIQEGHVTDDTRIQRVLPTLQELCVKQAKVIILSHFGRPDGKVDPALSLAGLAPILAEKLHRHVSFAKACIGPQAIEQVAQLREGQILLLENLRFHSQEEQNEAEFAQALASLGEIYVNDAFSCSHRAHASIASITSFIPSYAGRSLEMEIKTLNQVLSQPKRPVAAVVGGSKVSTKLEILTNLVKRVDYLIVGGGMANTFLLAQQVNIGASLAEANMIDTALAIEATAKDAQCQIVLPVDARITKEIIPNPITKIVPIQEVPNDYKIADIGPQSIKLISQIVEKCHTLVWNGPLGVFEVPPFENGTVALAHKIASQTACKKLLSVAGGGDTLAALGVAKCTKDLSYISCAGGAFLEWLEGKKLPGIAALEKSSQNRKQF